MHGATIVLKFGGSVLRDRAALPDAVREIARHVARGARVVAVVSALRGRTDELMAECRACCPALPPRAVAARVASGERECAALLLDEALRMGLIAQLQDPAALQMLARGEPLEAEPIGVSMPRLLAALQRHEVVVVPGFVAVDEGGDAALLGRGGSDWTALFLAQRLGARCRLVKDVDGLYASDPAASRGAQRVCSATFDEVARAGGKLVQEKALAFAKAHGLAFEIAAIGSDEPTVVGGDARDRAHG